MKFKLGMFLALLFTGLTVNAQEEDIGEIDKLPETQTERIIDKYGGKIVDGFTSLVETVTPMAENAFNMVVRLQIAKGIVHLLPSLIFLILLYCFNKYMKTAVYDEYGWNRQATLSIVYGVLSLIGLGVAIAHISEGIMYLIAPEWYAIKDIMKLI